MKKYYIILILVIIAGCASDSVSESKKESALEKKSPWTLKDPKSVHRKGKTAIISQAMTKAEEQKTRDIER